MATESAIERSQPGDRGHFPPDPDHGERDRSLPEPIRPQLDLLGPVPSTGPPLAWLVLALGVVIFLATVVAR